MAKVLDHYLTHPSKNQSKLLWSETFHMCHRIALLGELKCPCVRNREGAVHWEGAQHLRLIIPRPLPMQLFPFANFHL